MHLVYLFNAAKQFKCPWWDYFTTGYRNGIARRALIIIFMGQFVLVKN